MSPNKQNVVAYNNVYTALLLLVFCIVLATALFVAVKCYLQYDTIFKIP